ncbi:FHA domain-containing protein [Candidatus Uabimicrobium amorphum]|uniref:FHA domain-containing protein n=1 Tax=Uabimicrobium amorphum TaxID=2596890 RepID=A0A5S9INM0_UABAM|nr:FHA domain-containing protein [Candidatus Uabimicrobium amorphum]BBM84837.1 hypothetical protein UABAM_03198 [Candidatus Uabimicrobium amorphum]
MLVYLEDAQKKKYLIDEDSFNIGRDGSRCQLKLPNNRIFSALQATIIVQEDVPLLEKYILVDRSSNKNTFVNGKQVDKKMLKHGDRITFSQQQNFVITFRLNTSAPTLVPSNEGYIRPQLEEGKPDNLHPTIMEDKSTAATNGIQQIGDEEIQDLRNFMQKSMLERKEEEPQNFAETNDDFSIADNDKKTTETTENTEQEPAEKVKGIKISGAGEETEVDLKTDKTKLRQAYDKMVEKKPQQTPSSLTKIELISVIDGARFPIESGVVICGSSPKAHICFSNDPGIVEQNFKIIKGEDSIVINPLDNENILVNGAVLRESRKLNSKDIIRVGRQILYFLSGNKKYRSALTKSITQTKDRVKNFYTLQNAANDIPLSKFEIKISHKFSDKENVLYCVSQNNDGVFVFMGDLISTNIGFALVVQELRGAFSALTSVTDDLTVIARGLDKILKKYQSYSCESNVPLVCKGILLKFDHEKLSWLNCGSYLPPILIDSEENKAKELSSDCRVSLLGYLFDEEIAPATTCNFDRESALLLQPDCIPTKNIPKIMIKQKDVSDLLAKMKEPSIDTATQRLLASNVTSLVIIQRKSTELKCLQCERVFPSDYVFCPYDSTKLV